MTANLRKFNLQAQNLIPFETEGSLNEFHECLSQLLFSTENIGDLTSDHVEICQFYINLYKIMNSLDIESDILWKCIEILHQASKNMDARHDIVNKFKFFPLLSKILQQLIIHEQIEKILLLMQELSYGICIKWEEPYLCQLIPVLLREIDSIDGSLAYISLSILINISYKNFPVICLLIKTTNLKNFSEKIKPFGILAHKMLIILEYNNIVTTDTIDIYLFIKKSFAEIEYAIQNWNLPIIRHVIHFLIDSKYHNNIHTSLIEYENYESDIINLLKSITKLNFDHNNINNIINNDNDLIKKQQLCIGLIFDLFNYILQLTNTNVNLMLTQELYQKIADFLYPFLDSKYAGEKAIDLLVTVIKFGNNNLLSNIATKLPVKLQKLVTVAQNNEISNKLITSLHKLIICLLNRTQTQSLILTHITEQYFDKILSSILNVKPELLSFSQLTSDELSKYIYCILVLNEFSIISKTKWKGKMKLLFQNIQIQYILAKGMLIENESLCNVVFEISKIENFPQKEVAKFVAQLSDLVIRTPPNLLNINKSISSILLTPIRNISKDCEERLTTLVERIFKENSTNPVFDATTSELIELFHFKMNLINSKIENLAKRLDKSAEENTELSHEISLHNTELAKYQSINFKMHIQQERLELEIKDLTNQKDILKDGLDKLGNKFREEHLKHKSYAKLIETKDTELVALRKDLFNSNDKDTKNLEEMSLLKLKLEENAVYVEKLKDNLLSVERTSKVKDNVIEEHDDEILKLNRNISELRAMLEKSENVVKNLKDELAKKDEVILLYETELNEAEEMKNTILSLMENIKLKKKKIITK